MPERSHHDHEHGDHDHNHDDSGALAPEPPTTSASRIERLNPDGLPPAIGYCQATVARGTRIVHVSGQVGIDAEGELVGADHRSQVEQAMCNLQLGLAAAGATIDDVVKSTFYVVDYSPDVLGALGEASVAVFGSEAPDFAATLIGVATLADPSYLVEIEATAVL